MFLFGVFGGVVFLEFKGEAGGSEAAAGHPFAVQVSPGRSEPIGGDGEAADGMGAGGQGQGADAVGGGVCFADGDAEPEALPVGRRGLGIVGVDADDESPVGEIPDAGGDGPVEQFPEQDIIDVRVGLEVAGLFDIGHAPGRAFFDGHGGEKPVRGRGVRTEGGEGAGQQGGAECDPMGVHERIPFVDAAAPCGARHAGDSARSGVAKSFPGLRTLFPCLRERDGDRGR